MTRIACVAPVVVESFSWPFEPVGFGRLCVPGHLHRESKLGAGRFAAAEVLFVAERCIGRHLRRPAGRRAKLDAGDRDRVDPGIEHTDGDLDLVSRDQRLDFRERIDMNARSHRERRLDLADLLIEQPPRVVGGCRLPGLASKLERAAQRRDEGILGPGTIQARRNAQHVVEIFQPLFERRVRRRLVLCNTANRCVEAVEHAALFDLRILGGRDQAQPALLPAAQFQRAHLLRLLLAAAVHADLEEAPARDRVILAGIDNEKVSAAGAALGDIKFFCLPGQQARFYLLGKLFGIGRGTKRDRRQVAGELVMPVPVRRRAVPARHDHGRPEAADRRHHVGEDHLLAPQAGALFAALGKTEVVRAREQLFGAVESTRLQQLLAADDAEQIAELGADDVLPAGAPGQ